MKPENLPKDGFWVYMIVNRINMKVYIGKTKRPYHRCHQYVYDFRERALGHLNDHLFNAMRSYGIDNFEMFMLEKCENELTLSERELAWIDAFNSTNRNKGYNFRRDSQTGMIVHPETSKKISANLKQQWKDGVRNQHSEKLKANWDNNPSRRLEQSKLFKKYRTKWKYLIFFSEVPFEADYEMLKVLGMRNIIATFHKSRNNSVTFKGWKVERVLNGP